MVTQIGFLGIIVDDLAAATAFYRDGLGMTVNESASIPSRYTQFQLAAGPVVGLLLRAETTEGQSFEPGVVVDDVDATHAAWRQRGVELLEDPHDMPFGRTFLFRAPDGQVLRAYKPQSR